jgi:hypothetical protein
MRGHRSPTVRPDEGSHPKELPAAAPIARLNVREASSVHGASVVTHADLVVSRLVRARATLAMIVATDAVHTNGFGRWL